MLYQPKPRSTALLRRIGASLRGFVGAAVSALAKSGADQRALDRMTPAELEELGLHRPEPGRYDRLL